MTKFYYKAAQIARYFILMGRVVIAKRHVTYTLSSLSFKLFLLFYYGPAQIAQYWTLMGRVIISKRLLRLHEFFDAPLSFFWIRRAERRRSCKTLLVEQWWSSQLIWSGTVLTSSTPSRSESWSYEVDLSSFPHYRSRVCSVTLNASSLSAILLQAIRFL